MASVTNSQSSSVVTSSSANNSDISDVENAIARKNNEYIQAVEELSSLVEDYPEYESVHERVDSLIDHKVRMVMGLMEQVKLASPEVPENLHEDVEKLLGKTVKGLSQELRDLKACLKKNEAQILEADKEFASLVKQMELLKTAVEKRGESKEMHTLEELKRKSRTAAREFQKHKQLLHETINEIFPNHKELVHDLFGCDTCACLAVHRWVIPGGIVDNASLISSSTDVLPKLIWSSPRARLYDLCAQLFQPEGGDNYITVDTDMYYPVLEILLEGHIVKRHPYDKKKVKLAGY